MNCYKCGSGNTIYTTVSPPEWKCQECGHCWASGGCAGTKDGAKWNQGPFIQTPTKPEPSRLEIAAMVLQGSLCCTVGHGKDKRIAEALEYADALIKLEKETRK